MAEQTTQWSGSERREQCLHHSGLETDIKHLIKQGDANCKKMDVLKMYVITMLGGLAVSLFIQIAKLMGG